VSIWNALQKGIGAVWKAGYSGGEEHKKGDMVRANGFLLSANKDTSENANITPIDEPYFLYSSTLTPEVINNVKQIIFGTRYIWTTATGYLNKYRVDVVVGNVYEIYLITDTLGTPIVEQIGNFEATSSGWIEVNISPVLIGSAVTFDVIAQVNQPDPAPVQFVGNWDYSKPNNAAAPASGQISHANKQLDQLWIHKTDNDSGDRSAELLALSVGDIIEVGSMSWAIQTTPVDSGVYITINISPQSQSAALGVQAFTFNTTATVNLTRGIETDYYLGNAAVRGLYIADDSYVNITPNDNAYGIDIEVQAANVPVDWDIMTTDGTSTGGSTAPKTYFFSKVRDILDIGDTYEPIVKVTTPELSAGTVMYGMSWTYSYDANNASVYMRFSINNGSTWNEFISEPSDTTDVNANTYAFPIEVATDGALTLEVEARKETGANQFDVLFFDVWIEKK